MTPKEKAKELVGKMYQFAPLDKIEFYSNDNMAKQCALTAVTEIIKSKELNYLFTKEQINCMEGTSDDIWVYETFMKYWLNVKKEIKKL